MPDYDAFPPHGFDWADGQDIRPGTPSAEQAVLQSPDFTDLGFLEELPNSPEIERGDQATFRHSYKADWDTAILIISALGRGAYVRDSRGYTFRILTSQVTREKPNIAIIVITSESISFDNPPDEFRVDEIEINPEIEKHPAYVAIAGDGNKTNPYNLNNFGAAISATQLTGPQIIDICKQAAGAASAAGGNEFLSRINEATVASDWVINDANGNPVFTVTAAAIRDLATSNLYLRYLKGETTFYLAGFKVTWASYYYLPPLVDPGCYIQDPVTQGALPAYFWSTTQDTDGLNIFINLAIVNNPLFYLSGLSWLRGSDNLDYQRTWFKLTRTWLGGPLGQWDKGIYPTLN